MNTGPHLKLEQIAIQRRRVQHTDYYGKMSDEHWVQDVATKESHGLIQKDLRQTWNVETIQMPLQVHPQEH
jgi:hypothetical protein